MSSTWLDLLDEPEVIKVYRGHGNDPRLEVLLEFHYAVCAGDLPRVKRAITPEIDLNTLFGDDWDGYTALHHAVLHIDVFAFLLALGANPFALSYPGHEQPLHGAVDRGQPDVVRLLLDLGADVNSSFETCTIVDPKPTTPLWLAMHSSHRTLDMRDDGARPWIKIIDILVSRGAEFPPDTQKYASWGEIYEPNQFHPPVPEQEDALLVKALSSESRMLWRSYLEKRCAASPPEATATSTDGTIPEAHRSLLEDFGRRDEEYKGLIAAGWLLTNRPDQVWLEERLQVARILLDSRAPLDTRDINLITALCHHCFRGHLELVELILKRGADATAVGQGGATPLLVACGSHLISFHTTQAVIELLLNHGAGFGVRVRDAPPYQPPFGVAKYVPGSTILHFWAARRDLGLLCYLLDAGADAGAANDSHETVLMRFAAEMGERLYRHHKEQDNVASLTMLLDAGASLGAVDGQGRTVLHVLIQTCDKLLRVCPRREKKNPDISRTRESSLRCLELLARRGADPSIEDKDGKKPVSGFRDPVVAKRWLGSELAAFLGLAQAD